MPIIHRLYHKIAPGKLGEAMAWERKFEAVQAKHGVPPFRWCEMAFGAQDAGNLIGDQEWPSYAEMEARYSETYGDPAWQALMSDPAFYEVFLSGRHEILHVIE